MSFPGAEPGQGGKGNPASASRRWGGKGVCVCVFAGFHGNESGAELGVSVTEVPGRAGPGLGLLLPPPAAPPPPPPPRAR